ncbi:unnamed protein product [Adineta ricciae]|uniref:PAS domain-containing protein n=1 Tax=Adineta ricciae TaxID=249248 RepID=A0A813MYW8_ADIRI|nr:unnamed protein product [Adineta ricciae]CAF1593024.1 unnamed protein product [Adineta ricciae]
MQNPLPFYSEYNSYPTADGFLSHIPDTTLDSNVFALCPSTSLNPNPMPMVPQLTPSNTTTSTPLASKKRKATIDTDVSYSPASIYSDNSNISDASYPTFHRRSTDFSRGLPPGRTGTMANTSMMTTSAEEGSSDDNDDDEEENDLARKREKHTQVEAQRRALEKAHFRELSTLISDRNDSKSAKLHHLDLLKIAAKQITEMNARHKHDPLRPSNLTDSELNFLTIEASNSFLFVTTVESASFCVIRVTDSINRVLNATPEQWLGHNFLSFIHPEDVLRIQSQLVSLNQRVGIKIHFDCRIKQGNSDSYSSVNVDGTTKILDHSLTPLQTNAPGILAFIGICHLPLITKYSETNMSIYKNPQLFTFRCRCSPHDWKIFLIDRSVSTLPSTSCDTFRHKSILDFIAKQDQAHVHQTLLRSTTTATDETISCHFIYPNNQSLIPMTLEIKSFFNPVLHRADFIELTFKCLNDKADTSLYDLTDGAKEIEKLLLESDPTTSASASMQQTNHPQLQHHQLQHHPTTQNAPFFDVNDWITKDELF